MVISCAVLPGEPPEVPVHVDQAIPAMTSKPESDLAQLEPFVQNEANSSRLSTPAGIERAGVVMDMISSTASSDNFTTVMGYLKRFVEIGDAVSEVGMFPPLDFPSDKCLCTGSPLRETCMECANLCAKCLLLYET